MTTALDVVSQVPAAVWLAISAASFACSVAGIAAVPWMVCRMPADWFARSPLAFRDRLKAHPVRVVLRNLLGIGLILLGIALLFLPGQGILTIVLGVVLTDLPIRDKGLHWVARRPKLASQLQTWRYRSGKAPFTDLPGSGSS